MRARRVLCLGSGLGSRVVVFALAAVRWRTAWIVPPSSGWSAPRARRTRGITRRTICISPRPTWTKHMRRPRKATTKMRYTHSSSRGLMGSAHWNAARNLGLPSSDTCRIRNSGRRSQLRHQLQSVDDWRAQRNAARWLAERDHERRAEWGALVCTARVGARARKLRLRTHGARARRRGARGRTCQLCRGERRGRASLDTPGQLHAAISGCRLEEV